MQLNNGKYLKDMRQKKGIHTCLTEDIAIINLKSAIKKAPILATKNLIKHNPFKDSKTE
jgi:hypothetical protein